MDNGSGYIQPVIDRKTLKSSVGTQLVACGYQKKGQTWYKTGSDIVAAVELQKSQYSEFYYVNVAFNIRALLGNELPATHKSHIWLRAERLMPECEDEIESLFRLDNAKLTADEQATALAEFFKKKLVPSCDELLDFDRLRTEYKNGRLRKAAVRSTAAQFLDL